MTLCWPPQMSLYYLNGLLHVHTLSLIVTVFSKDFSSLLDIDFRVQIASRRESLLWSLSHSRSLSFSLSISLSLGRFYVTKACAWLCHPPIANSRTFGWKKGGKDFLNLLGYHIKFSLWSSKRFLGWFLTLWMAKTLLTEWLQASQTYQRSDN